MILPEAKIYYFHDGISVPNTQLYTSSVHMVNSDESFLNYDDL
jgi:hypothetical protein